VIEDLHILQRDPEANNKTNHKMIGIWPLIYDFLIQTVTRQQSQRVIDHLMYGVRFLEQSFLHPHHGNYIENKRNQRTEVERVLLGISRKDIEIKGSKYHIYEEHQQLYVRLVVRYMRGVSQLSIRLLKSEKEIHLVIRLALVEIKTSPCSHFVFFLFLFLSL
jgi:hypothetical protein